MARLPRRAVAGLLALLAVTAGMRGAGDLLRGGASANSTAAASGATGSAATAPLRANAHDQLARTTQALQAMQAMQAAARALAAAGPNN